MGDIYQVHAYASLTNGKQQVFIEILHLKWWDQSADVTIKNYSAENGTFVVVENIVAPARSKRSTGSVSGLRNQSDILVQSRETV